MLALPCNLCYCLRGRDSQAYYPTKRFPNATQNIIGYVPQVNHTFGYYEGNYAISNDQGISFGESTTSAKTYALPKPAGPSLLSMLELSRLAAERASTSRAAVLLMGEMAERYGFYGDPSADTGGESILVADADEQFIFHILAESVEKGGNLAQHDHLTPWPSRADRAPACPPVRSQRLPGGRGERYSAASCVGAQLYCLSIMRPERRGSIEQVRSGQRSACRETTSPLWPTPSLLGACVRLGTSSRDRLCSCVR